MTLQVNNLQTDKEKLESYTKKTLHKFQDKYMVAISHCKAQIAEKNEKIDYLEVRKWLPDAPCVTIFFLSLLLFYITNRGLIDFLQERKHSSSCVTRDELWGDLCVVT